MTVSPKLLPAGLLDQIRSRFHHVDVCPITKAPRIYFENGGGSLKLRAAIAAGAEIAAIPDQEQRDNDASRHISGIINRGREDLRLFLGAKDGQVISGETGTELLYRFIRAVALSVPSGPFLSSSLEHPASFDSAKLWADRTGRQRIAIKLDIHSGTVTPEDYARAVTPDTRLATIIHTSQLTGLHVDLPGIVAAIRKVSPDCFVIIDGIQNAPHGRVEVDAYGADAYVFSAYKAYSRLAVGFGWIGPRLERVPHEHMQGKSDRYWELGSRDPGIYAAHSEVVAYFEWVGGHFTSSGERRAHPCRGGRNGGARKGAGGHAHRRRWPPRRARRDAGRHARRTGQPGGPSGHRVVRHGRPLGAGSCAGLRRARDSRPRADRRRLFGAHSGRSRTQGLPARFALPLQLAAGNRCFSRGAEGHRWWALTVSGRPRHRSQSARPRESQIRLQDPRALRRPSAAADRRSRHHRLRAR